VFFFYELKNFKGEDATIILSNGSSMHAKILAIEFKNLNFIVGMLTGLKK